MTTTIRIGSSGLVISSARIADATVSGPDAAVAELKDVVAGRPELFPDSGHSDEFHRQQLRGEKAMPIETFDAFLVRVARRFGLETVRRIGNRWFAKFGMHLVDLPNVVTVKTPDEKLLESTKEFSTLVVAVSQATANGEVDDQERRTIKRAADQTIAAVRDVAEAACR